MSLSSSSRIRLRNLGSPKRPRVIWLCIDAALKQRKDQSILNLDMCLSNALILASFSDLFQTIFNVVAVSEREQTNKEIRKKNRRTFFQALDIRNCNIPKSTNSVTIYNRIYYGFCVCKSGISHAAHPICGAAIYRAEKRVYWKSISITRRE